MWKKSMFHLLTFNNLQNHLNQFVQKAKQNYLNKIAKKLSDPSTSNVTCLCYETLLNDKKHHAYYLYFTITSTLLILKKKNEIFITFFAEQGSLIPNKS